MDRKHSISPLGITNFLESGALLRHKGQWVLIEGPFSPVKTPNSSAISVFCPDFYEQESHPLWWGAKEHLLTTQELRGFCEDFLHANPLSHAPLSKASWSEPREEDFATDLEVIQGRIKSKAIDKAVPVIFARSRQTVTAVEKAQMILSLTQAPETLYVFGFWQNGEGILGATPETLFDYDKGVLQTMALAGTCPKSESTERASLLMDEKEMQEHGLVVDDLTQRLSQWGEVGSHGPYILELPTLFHLKTDFQVHCQTQPDFRTLAMELHPTPALGVAPRSAGYKWMHELPGQEGRRGYGAPFAFLGTEEALCLVAIRNLQWNKNESMIGSGCGIVAASEFTREWRELFQKRLSVRKILGLEV
ncbi:MAG: chorismate-binding protein [Bdellovibrio sp.]|nr:chorismate-binding protein [Bdellovibrio sp.]